MTSKAFFLFPEISPNGVRFIQTGFSYSGNLENTHLQKLIIVRQQSGITINQYAGGKSI